MKVYYESLFLISLALTAIYAIIWQKRFYVFFSLIFAFIPVTNLGYAIIGNAQSLESAIIGIKLTYIGACYLILFLMYSIFNLCNLNIKKWIRMVLLLVSTAIFLAALTIGKSEIFYKNISAEMQNGALVLFKEYSLTHTLFYIIIASYLALSIFVTFYALKKKNDVSNTILQMLLLCELITAALFFGGRIITRKIDLVPLGFVISEIIFLFIIRRISFYDVTDTVIDSIALNGETGFISFDNGFHYLGCNKMALELFPELANIKIDSPATRNKTINDELIEKIKDFIQNNSSDHFFKNYKDKIFQININYLYGINKNKKRGYMLYIQDDTQDQKYISLLDNFNIELQNEVAKKTADIVKMHDQLVLGMATMVESRDNSTGGHIKRTSDVVKILVDQIMKNNELGLSKEFCKNIVKAAPMHDLGKIAVDDAILRKPGRFTDEEFEKMKLHASEGARIVHEILKDTDDLEFHLIAENVAHYHHERWDGTGYPEGLKGESIPLEARIMAIADVYDALVSKRVYKESMSFEQADKIIMEGMGKHFDKKLEKYYIAARPLMEEYYSRQ